MSWHAYPRWQLALANFSALPWDLSVEQLPELERQLARKLALEELVLASELASQVQVTPQMVNQARSQLVSQYGSEATLLQIQQQAAIPATTWIIHGASCARSAARCAIS